MSLAAVLVSFGLLLANWVNPLDHASCPTILMGHVWWVNGIRPSGGYGCRPRSLKPDHPSRGKEPDEPPDPEADYEVFGSITCPPGLAGVVVDWQHVSCGTPNYQSQTE